MNPLISIITPVYNQRKDLFDKCVDSALNQDYPNIEFLIVDDGSTDGTSKYCDNLALKDHRVKVIHQQNKRQGAARNAALDVAAGEFVFFLDSDDWIEPDTLSYLYRYIKLHDADIAVCRGFKQLNTGEIIKPEYRSECVKVLDLKDAFDSYVYDTQYCSHSPCDKLYNKKLFNCERFIEDSYYEDLGSIYKFISRAKRIVYTDKYLYCYYDNHCSTMHKKFSTHEFDKIKIYYNLSKYFGNTEFIDKREQWRKELEKQCLYCAIGYISNACQQCDKLEYEDSLRMIRLICKELTSSFGFRLNFIRRLIIVSPLLFDTVWKVYQKLFLNKNTATQAK